VHGVIARVMQALLDLDVSVSPANKHGATPLHCAAARDHAQTAALLVRRCVRSLFVCRVVHVVTMCAQRRVDCGCRQAQHDCAARGRTARCVVLCLFILCTRVISSTGHHRDKSGNERDVNTLIDVKHANVTDGYEVCLVVCCRHVRRCVRCMCAHINTCCATGITCRTCTASTRRHRRRRSHAFAVRCVRGQRRRRRCAVSGGRGQHAERGRTNAAGCRYWCVCYVYTC
jgi:hypothetical protein